MALSFFSLTVWPWFSDTLSNIATAFFSSLVIYYLIEKSLEKSREEEKSKRKKIALTRIQEPLEHLLTFLLQIYKASKIKPAILPENYEDLFSEDYFESVRYLDFQQDAPVTPKRSWTVYSSETITDVHDQFDKIIDAYGFVLDNDIIENIEEICSCNTFHFFKQVRVIPQVDKEYGIKRKYLLLYEANKLLKVDVPKFLKLLSLITGTKKNIIFNREDFVRDDVSPGWGVNKSGVKLD